MPIPLIAGAAISAGGSIISGLLGKSAAQKAADTQAGAAQAAGQKVVNATALANPLIQDAADKAAASVSSATGGAASDVERTGQRSADLLDPYANLGSDAVNALSMKMDSLTKAPTMADIQIDPGFQFRLEQGQKALERSAAAKGGLLTGGTIKATESYAQNLASDEYAKAFDRYRATQGDSFSRLSALLGQGEAAATRQGDTLVNTGEFAGTTRVGGSEYAGNAERDAATRTAENTINASRAEGDYLTQGANAKAAGIVSGANALNSGITGGAGSVTNALLLSQLLSPKAAAPKASPGTALWNESNPYGG